MGFKFPEIENIEILPITDDIYHVSQVKSKLAFTKCDGLIIAPRRGRNSSTIVIDLNLEPKYIYELAKYVEPVSNYIVSHGHLDHSAHVHVWEEIGASIHAPYPHNKIVQSYDNLIDCFQFSERIDKRIVEDFGRINGYQSVKMVKSFSPGSILEFKKVLERMRSYTIPALMDTEPMTIKALVDVADRNITELQKHKKSVISLLFGMITKMGFGMFKLNFAAKPRTIYGTLFPHKATAKALQYGNRQLALLQQKSSKLRTVDEKLKFVAQEAPTTSFTIGYGMTFYLMPLFGYLDRAGKILKKYLDEPSGDQKETRKVTHGFATATELGLGSTELEKVERAVPGSVTTEMGLEMLFIAKKLDQSGEEPHPDHPEIKRFLEIYGHRSTEEIDIGVLSWKEEPTYVINLINSYIDQKVYRIGLEKFEKSKHQAEQAITTIAAKIREKGAGRDAAKVEKLLRAHRKYFGARELPKSVLVRGIGILREVLLEIGAELQARNRLDHDTDVFFVTSEDICSGAKLQDTVQQNREEYERELLRTPVPRVMTSSGETIYAVTEDQGDDLLRGIPASPGVYEGLVRILKRPEEGNRLEKGDILVTASTNPAWTPLFLKIGGVIVETGTPMSHGPVVAREYGIPAVAGLRDATSRLEDGQRVRINGETGSVEILDSAAGTITAGADIRR